MKDKIEKINESRIVKHISGRWLIQINDSEFEYLDEWINHYITQANDIVWGNSDEDEYPWKIEISNEFDGEENAEEAKDWINKALEFYKKVYPLKKGDTGTFLVRYTNLELHISENLESGEKYQPSDVQHNDDADWENEFDELYWDDTHNQHIVKKNLKQAISKWIQSARNDALMQGFSRNDLRNIKNILKSVDGLTLLKAKLDKLLEKEGIARECIECGGGGYFGDETQGVITCKDCNGSGKTYGR